MDTMLEQLDLNITFFYQFALFLVFFFLISSVYLKPFQSLLEKRNQKLKADVQSAADLLQEVERRLADYEKEISSVRLESAKNYEKNISESRIREDAAIHAFREELKKEYLQATEKLQGEKQRIEAELQAQAAGFAESFVQKTLTGKSTQ